MQENKHKLHIGLESDDEKVQLIYENGEHVATVENYPVVETAKRMVQCWNEHDQLKELNRELVAALKDANATLYRWAENDAWDERDVLTQQNIQAALAKANSINQ